MTREETGQPIVTLFSGEAYEGFLQRDRRAGVISSFRHEAGAVVVRLALRVATIFLRDELRAELARSDYRIAVLRARSADCRCEQAHLDQRAAFDLLRAVPGG